MLDLTLAIAHHVLVFGLAVMLAMELALSAPIPCPWRVWPGWTRAMAGSRSLS